MALRALLEIFDEDLQRWVIAIGPDGLPIVGDPETGEGWECCCGGGGGCCYIESVQLCGRPDYVDCNLGESFIATFSATASSYREEWGNFGSNVRQSFDLSASGVIRHYKQPADGCFPRTQCLSLSYHSLYIITNNGTETNRTERFADCDNRTYYNFNPGRGGGRDATYLLGEGAEGGGPLFYPQSPILVRSGTSPWDVVTNNNTCQGQERWWNGTVGGELIAQSTWNRVETCRSGTLEYHLPPYAWFAGTPLGFQGRADYSASIEIVPERECSGSDALRGDTGPGAESDRPIDPGIADFLRRQRGCEGCGG